MTPGGARAIYLRNPPAGTWRTNIGTIKKISALAGVSIGTVDRVLHKRGRVSPATEARILRIIKDLEYKPNIFARNLKLSKVFRFGLLMPRPDQDSGYWTLPLKGVARAEAELRSQKVRVHRFFYDKHSAGSLARARRKVLSSSLDGLLVAPVTSPGFLTFLRDLPARIPYVFFDSFIPDVPCLSAIGQDSFQSGILSARLMKMLIAEPGHVAVIRVRPKDFHIDSRIEGFLAFCQRCPRVTSEISEINGDGGMAGDARVFGRIFRQHPDLKGIFVANASTHRAAAYVKARAAAGRVHVIGYDLIDENVRSLREGVVDFLISQQPERQGYEGIYALYRHIVLKEPVPKQVMMQIDIITAENVGYYRS